MACATTLGLGLGAPAQAATTPLPTGSGTDGAWSVRAAGADSWTVSLTLDSPLPVRAAQPELAVDGTVLGVAREAADRHTLTLRTSDPRVLRAADVQLAWNGLVADEGTGLLRHAAPGASLLARTAPNLGPLLAQDPAARGTSAVLRADYDLGDTAVRLPGLNGQAVELRAAVYLPQKASGPRPVVVFLHGRHQACYGDTESFDSWPCARGSKPVPSHLGYGQAAEALASQGYAVVSISADGINALDWSAPDGGAQARGELVLAHLDLLAQLNSGRVGVKGGSKAAQAAAAKAAATLKGRLDLDDVGLMGHSRGGEGVVEAALLNDERPAPYGIKAVLPLAPTDFARTTLPGAAMAVVLPYCDGDVSDQQGQHYYDDTRYAARDDVLRSSLLVMGANHNFFNSEWTPGTSAAPSSDDWYDDTDPVCGSAAKSRLSAAEQRAVGAAYVSGFFRLTLGGEKQFLPLFDGTGGRAASAGRAVVDVQAQQPRSARVDLAPLTGPSPAVRIAGGAVYCAGQGEAVAGRPVPCAGSDRSAGDLPHWTPAYFAANVPTNPVLHLTWNPRTVKKQSVAVDVAKGSIRGTYQALTFRAATGSAKAGDGLDVTLTDAAGRRSTVAVSRYSDALTPLPTLAAEFGGTAKIVMQTVRVPLSAFTGVDLGKVRTVTFTPSSTRGDVFLGDVALDSPAPGHGAPSTLPAVSIGDVAVEEGNATSTVSMPLVLSHPSTVPVTVNVDTGVDNDDARFPSVWKQVTIPAGARTASVALTVDGNTETDPTTTLHVTLSAPTNAIVGDGWGNLQLLDDDFGQD